MRQGGARAALTGWDGAPALVVNGSLGTPGLPCPARLTAVTRKQ